MADGFTGFQSTLWLPDAKPPEAHGFYSFAALWWGPSADSSNVTSAAQNEVYNISTTHCQMAGRRIVKLGA